MNNEYPLKLSIIVPVYNVEKYLERCVNSLLHQDIDKSEYEIILVNDGSTDNSYEIAKRLTADNENIILLSQENQGLSGARNTGIEVIRGQYVMFVDSDDYVKENVLKSIVFAAESNSLDICIYKCMAKWVDGTFHDDMGQPFEINKIFSGEQLLLQGYQVASVWNCLYRTDFIKHNNMRFYPRILHEDVEFNNRIYPLAKRVMLIDTVCYYYCIHTDTLSRGNTPVKVMRIITSDIEVAAQLQLAAKFSLYSEPIQNLLVRKSRSIMCSVLMSLIRETRLGRQEKLSCLAFAKSRGVYPCVGRSLSWKNTLLSYLISIEPFYKRLL